MITKTTTPKIVLIQRFFFLIIFFLTPFLVPVHASAQSHPEPGLPFISTYASKISIAPRHVWSVIQTGRGTMCFVATSGLTELDEETWTQNYWYATWQAFVIYLIILVFLMFLINMFQKRQLLAKVHEENREKELKQAREIQKAHENLKTMQEQLIQQEKLASLGQLTAGIAHEIKNPLNFVNNFSELSLEYIEEIYEEMTKLEQSEITEDIRALLEDVKYNLQKILQHGSRADGIVKSMLMHSRGGKGIMELTDLNELVKEYVNLAFHGMRANKNPINVDIQLQLDEKLPKVNLNPEDFSRVILNLCKNAFDAMRDKTIDNTTGYLPRLIVSTREMGDKIFLEVEDNGPGISEENRGKLLMPFFTTKKGTEGTGLGLSITHDIVKAHEGTLEINSEVGNFTRFSITLMNTQNKD